MDYTGFVPDEFDVYIFDLDGTLVDSLSDLTFAVNETLSKYDLPALDEATVRKGVGTGARNLLLHAFTVSDQGDKKNVENLVDQALPFYIEFYEANSTRSAALYPGMKEWVEHLHARGKKLAVLTNKGDSATKHIVHILGIEEYFSIVAGPEYGGCLKPEGGGILRIINDAGVTLSRTLMIGDSMVDFEAARNAGVKVCGISGGLGDEEALREAGCDYFIERVSASDGI